MSGAPWVQLDPPAAVAWLAAAARGTSDDIGLLGDAPLVVVDLAYGDTLAAAGSLAPWLPSVVVAATRGRPRMPAPPGVDIAVTAGPPPVPPGWIATPDVDQHLRSLAAAVGSSPHVAVMLAQVLRAGEGLDQDQALVVESLAYSALQAAPPFAAWLATRRARPVRPRSDRQEPAIAVLVDRQGDEMDVTLNRPHVRNAVNACLRDQLCEALVAACADPAIRHVHLHGAGPAFCSGGDLDDFGTRPDVVTAHMVRTARSPARLLAAVADRTTAHIHGACVGAGIELASFAHRVVAAPDTQVQLPEIGLGLIPGAGGTVSIPRRIGRHRTAWLALTAATIDAPTAQSWGLIDEVTLERS